MKVCNSYGINKCFSVKECSNLVKSFAIPLIDFGNAIIDYDNSKCKKFDKVLFFDLKHALRFR